MASVSIKDLHKSFGRNEVVKGVSIDIADDQFVVLVGPSGCGKSTLLRMIAGLEEITSGELSIGGKDVTDVAARDRKVAMVFQSYALYPHMSVYENMAFALRMAHMDKAEVDKRVQEAARALHMETFLERKPAQLSGGQRQRVALGRAIVRDVEVLLLDEPLSNLDAALRVEMRLELMNLHERMKRTMIYVTHDQVEAMTLADKIVVLEAGFVRQIGNPTELYEHPANTFVAGFIGSPHMNFLKAKVVEASHAHVRIESGDLGAVDLPIDGTGLEPGAAVIVGLRPEDIDLAAGGGVGIEATADFVEYLGRETSFKARAKSGASLTALIDGRFSVARGTALVLHFSPASCHLFDSQGKSCRRLAKGTDRIAADRGPRATEPRA
jgi:ABC-type sugar transport system ATPase subunit